MKRKKVFKLIIVVLILAGVGTGAFFYVDLSLRPSILALSQVRVRYYAVNVMNNAVKDVLSQNDGLETLVEVIRDDNGAIKMVKTDAVSMNKLSTLVTQRAQEGMGELDSIEFAVPLGLVLTNGLLSGRGPDIKVKMLHSGSVSTDFSTVFENAGINQTWLRVYLVMSTQIRVFAPLAGESVNVEAKIPVTEMIIVGEVPDTYINVPNMDDALNLIP